MERIVSWQLPDGYYAYMGQESGSHVRFGKLDDDKATQIAKEVAQYTDKEYSDEYDTLKKEVTEKFPSIVMADLNVTQTAHDGFTVLMLDSDGLVKRSEINNILSSKISRIITDYQKEINNYVDGKIKEYNANADSIAGKTDDLSNTFKELKSGVDKKITVISNQSKENKAKLSDLDKNAKSFEVVKDWYNNNKELSLTDIEERFAAIEDECKRLADEFASLNEMVSQLPTKGDLANAVKSVQTISSDGNSIKVDNDGIWLKVKGMDEYKKITVDGNGKISLE